MIIYRKNNKSATEESITDIHTHTQTPNVMYHDCVFILIHELETPLEDANSRVEKVEIPRMVSTQSNYTY